VAGAHEPASAVGDPPDAPGRPRDGAGLRAAVEALVESEPRIAVGIGRAADAGAIRHSLRDAEIAIQRVTQDRRGRLMDFDDFDLATLVLSEAPSERIEPKVEQLTGVLRANPALQEAIVAYPPAERGQAATGTAALIAARPWPISSGTTGVPANWDCTPSIQRRQRSVSWSSSVCSRPRVTSTPRSAPL